MLKHFSTTSQKFFRFSIEKSFVLSLFHFPHPYSQLTTFPSHVHTSFPIFLEKLCFVFTRRLSLLNTYIFIYDTSYTSFPCVVQFHPDVVCFLPTPVSVFSNHRSVCLSQHWTLFHRRFHLFKYVNGLFKLFPVS